MQKTKELKFYQAGMFLSILGDSFSTIALSWWILTVTHSALTLSFVLTPALLVKIFLTPLVGPIGDSYNRKKLIIFSCTWLSIAVGLLTYMAFKNIFITHLVIGIFVFKSIGSAIQSSVITAYIANIVGRENIGKAMVQNRIVFTAANILGYSIGGCVVSFFGVVSAFAFDACSFILCALFILLIKKENKPQVDKQNTTNIKIAFVNWKTLLVDGFKSAFQLKILLSLALVFMLLNFSISPLSVLIPLLVKNSGHRPWIFGTIEIAFGVGAICAGFFLGKLMNKVRHDLIVLFSLALSGPSFYLLHNMSNPLFAVLGMFSVGLCLSIANIVIDSKILASIPDHYRSRISTSLGFFSSIASPLGIFFAGKYAEIFGAQQIVLIIAIMFLLVVPLLLFIPNFNGFLKCDENSGYEFLKQKYPQWNPKEI